MQRPCRMRVQVRAQSDVLHRKGNKGDERTYDVILLYLKSCIEGEQSSQTASYIHHYTS